MQTVSDIEAIRHLLARFANSFDRKDWPALRACLTENLYTDYSDLRGTPPETMGADHYVALREQALQHLQTHHLGGNPEIDVSGDSANATLSMVIYRRNQEAQILHTHCLYQFGLINGEGKWRIAGIVQKVFWSDGNKAIHAGIQS